MVRSPQGNRGQTQGSQAVALNLGTSQGAIRHAKGLTMNISAGTGFSDLSLCHVAFWVPSPTFGKSPKKKGCAR